jgi:hypothetical protein
LGSWPFGCYRAAQSAEIGIQKLKKENSDGKMAVQMYCIYIFYLFFCLEIFNVGFGGMAFHSFLL